MSRRRRKPVPIGDCKICTRGRIYIKGHTLCWACESRIHHADSSAGSEGAIRDEMRAAGLQPRPKR